MFSLKDKHENTRQKLTILNLLHQSLQMRSMSGFEASMLICFGASWPFAVAKTYKTKDVKSKSRLFLSLIIIGYLCGIMHKILYSMDVVVWLYVINLLLVGADFFLVLLYRNRKQD